MTTTVTHSFRTRREAELVVERLVQEHAIERTDIFVAPEGRDNSAGTGKDGALADGKGHEIGAGRHLPSLIEVSVDLQVDEKAQLVRAVFAEIEDRE